MASWPGATSPRRPPSARRPRVGPSRPRAPQPRVVGVRAAGRDAAPPSSGPPASRGDVRARHPSSSLLLRGHLLELGLAHSGLRLLAFALALELGAHELALLLRLRRHRKPPSAAVSAAPAARIEAQGMYPRHHAAVHRLRSSLRRD